MRFGLYAGGFLGPFGGAILAVLIPQLRDAFDATTSQVTFAITAYLVPFAAFQLVSGTDGARGVRGLRGVLGARGVRALDRGVHRRARPPGRGQRLPHAAAARCGG